MLVSSLILPWKKGKINWLGVIFDQILTGFCFLVNLSYFYKACFSYLWLHIFFDHLRLWHLAKVGSLRIKSSRIHSPRLRGHHDEIVLFPRKLNKKNFSISRKKILQFTFFGSDLSNYVSEMTMIDMRHWKIYECIYNRIIVNIYEWHM